MVFSLYLGVCTEVYFERILSNDNLIQFTNILPLCQFHLTFGRGRERPKIMIGSFLYPKTVKFVLNLMLLTLFLLLKTHQCGLADVAQ